MNIKSLLCPQSSGEKKPPTAAQKRKQTRKRRSYLRAGLQLLFFLLTPSLFTGAFSGVKYIFTQIGLSQPLETVSFIKTLAVLCLLTMIFGRFFCGYVCAFGALGDGVQFVSKKVQKKAKKKLPAIPSGVKKWLSKLPFGILTAIIILCALGVYGSLSGYSPWDVFSMATSLKFRLEGYGLGCVLLVLILVGMAWEPRFFCRFLCPMGAVFRLLPIFPWAILRRDRSRCGKGCSACTKNCPVEVSLGEGGTASDCIRCEGCRGICPRGNISSGKKWMDAHVEIVTMIKAALYLAAAAAIGCMRFI